MRSFLQYLTPAFSHSEVRHSVNSLPYVAPVVQRHYRCTNTRSIVHTGRLTSISSAKITHTTMNVDWLDAERSARFPIALPISRHQKAAGMGSVPHTWAYARKAPERSGRYRKSSTNAKSTQKRTMSDLLLG